MRRITHTLTILWLLAAMLSAAPSSTGPAAARPDANAHVYLPSLARGFTAPTVWDVAGFVAAVQAANNACPAASTIVLPPGVMTFTVSVDGSNALPVVACSLTILGNNTTLQRDPAGQSLRFFEVGSQGSLTLRGLTLSGGLMYGPGGAVYNRGSLTAQDVTFAGNTANFGGGLSNYGSASLDGVRFTRNQAWIFGGGLENQLSNTSLTGSKLQFTGNLNGALHASGGQVTITGSCLAGNAPNLVYGAAEPTYSAVFQNDGSTTLDLRGNWWGAANGPSGAGPGSGDSVSAKVNYANFAASPGGCPAGPAVTALIVSSPQVVTFDIGSFIFPTNPVTLTAQLFGLGAYSPAVHWSVVSGGGSFANPDANPAVYTPGGGLGQVILRAASAANPEVYSDYAVESAEIGLDAPRKWAVVLNNGTVPFSLFLKINGSYYARSGPLSLQILSGGGSLTPPNPNSSDFFYNAPAAAGSAVIRAGFKANPSVYQDLPVTINNSGPHTCSNLRVTPTGKQVFTIGMNPPGGAPMMTAATLNEAESLIGQTQVISVTASVKEPAVSPISAMTFTLHTDAGVSGIYTGTLVSGDGFNGVWRAQWVTNDTHCLDYVIEFNARNEVQTTQAGIAFR